MTKDDHLMLFQFNCVSLMIQSSANITVIESYFGHLSTLIFDLITINDRFTKSVQTLQCVATLCKKNCIFPRSNMMWFCRCHSGASHPSSTCGHNINPSTQRLTVWRQGQRLHSDWPIKLNITSKAEQCFVEGSSPLVSLRPGEKNSSPHLKGSVYKKEVNSKGCFGLPPWWYNSEM